MAKVRTAALLIFMISLGATCPTSGQDLTTNPDAVRLVVDDVHRLASVLRSPGPHSDTLAVLERDYLADASPGLHAYAARYDLTPACLAAALRERPHAYAHLDQHARAILAQEPALRSGFSRLRALLPEAVFPPVWFVIGHHGPGGLTRREGAIIAAEHYVGRAEDVVPLVLHEVAHFQQAMIQGVERYQRIYGADQTLLALALREGTAELVAELTTGRHINPAAEQYGLAHEKELWEQFSRDMGNREAGDWMFVQPSNEAWPPDLGYWVGYRIARRYYEQAEDRQQALYDLLDARDYAALLAASGYADQFTE